MEAVLVPPPTWKIQAGFYHHDYYSCKQQSAVSLKAFVPPPNLCFSLRCPPSLRVAATCSRDSCRVKTTDALDFRELVGVVRRDSDSPPARLSNHVVTRRRSPDACVDCGIPSHPSACVTPPRRPLVRLHPDLEVTQELVF